MVKTIPSRIVLFIYLFVYLFIFMEGKDEAWRYYTTCIEMCNMLHVQPSLRPRF